MMTQIGEIILSVLESRVSGMSVTDYPHAAQDCERALVAAIAQELDDLKKKYNTLKRNFESISHSAKKDNSEFSSVKKRADDALKEV